MKSITVSWIAGLLFCVIACSKQPEDCRNQVSNATHREFNGVRIPLEWTESTPVPVKLADSIQVGDSMTEILDECGVPYQDSVSDGHIRHDLVEDGTYLQVIGTQDNATRVLRCHSLSVLNGT